MCFINKRGQIVCAMIEMAELLDERPPPIRRQLGGIFGDGGAEDRRVIRHAE